MARTVTLEKTDRKLIEERKEQPAPEVRTEHKKLPLLDYGDPEDFDETEFLRKVKMDTKLTAREKIKIGLLATMAHRQGSEMKVLNPAAVKAVEVSDCGTEERGHGCISQRFLRTRLALPKNFHTLIPRLTCQEWSGITSRNDAWNNAARLHGDKSAKAQRAKSDLWNYIKAL